jgi:hypothetical protein
MAAAIVFSAGEIAGALPVVAEDKLGMRIAFACAVITFAIGCRTPAKLPPVDLAERGWRVREGQAVWRPGTKGPELSGEFVWAAHKDGRFLLQFLKTPLTIVEARGNQDAWEVSFPADRRTIRGSQGRSLSRRLAWLNLAMALRGERLSEEWAFTKTKSGWILANASTGEMIEGYLTP